MPPAVLQRRGILHLKDPASDFPKTQRGKVEDGMQIGPSITRGTHAPFLILELIPAIRCCHTGEPFRCVKHKMLQENAKQDRKERLQGFRCHRPSPRPRRSTGAPALGVSPTLSTAFKILVCLIQHPMLIHVLKATLSQHSSTAGVWTW